MTTERKVMEPQTQALFDAFINALVQAAATGKIDPEAGGKICMTAEKAFHEAYPNVFPKEVDLETMVITISSPEELEAYLATIGPVPTPAGDDQTDRT